MALRLASIVALAVSGVALGHGVVGLASSRSQPAEAAGVRAGQPDAVAAAPPQFTSSMRSWTQPGPASVASAPAEQEAVVVPTSLPVAQPELYTSGPATPTHTYTVRPGDTLSQIADRFGVDVDILAAANHVTDVNVLSPGVQLRVAAAPGAAQVGSRSVEPTTARPTEAAAAQPTATQVPAAQVPLARVPAAQPGVATAPAALETSGELAATSPDAAIRSFYALVAQREFDRAAGLWSQHMRSAYPPSENITSRFAYTQALTLTRADVVQLDTSNGRATVAVSLSEVVGSEPSTTRHYAGDWYLVRGPAGWLLDQPSLQPS